MVQAIHQAVASHKERILQLAQEFVRIKSVTGTEERMAKAVEKSMKELSFDDVHIDRTGNVIGCVGNGEKSILFDSHMDTVDVIDAEDWTYPPLDGAIAGGRLYGRGAVDMKGALAVSIHAAAIARDLGLLEGKRLIIAGSVMEEDYDGVAVHKMLLENGLHPDYAVFGEATNMQICRGHNGRALIELTVYGKAAHGSKPETGINPVYRLQTVVRRIEDLAAEISARQGDRGSLALTNIHCVTASNNSVPQSASIILDRRLCISEDLHTVEREMERILVGVEGTWRICDTLGTSWTGEPVLLHANLPAWEISEEHVLVRAAQSACKAVLGTESPCVKLGYTTDAIATAGMLGIPSIVLGPGDSANAHGKDEFCPVDELIRACEIYVHLCDRL